MKLTLCMFYSLVILNSVLTKHNSKKKIDNHPDIMDTSTEINSNELDYITNNYDYRPKWNLASRKYRSFDDDNLVDDLYKDDAEFNKELGNYSSHKSINESVMKHLEKIKRKNRRKSKLGNYFGISSPLHDFNQRKADKNHYIREEIPYATKIPSEKLIIQEPANRQKNTKKNLEPEENERYKDSAAISKMINDDKKEAKATRKQMTNFDLWNEESKIKPSEINDNKKEAKVTRKQLKSFNLWNEDREIIKMINDDKKEAKATRKQLTNFDLWNEESKIKPSENNDAKKEAKATRKKEKKFSLWNEDSAAISKMINDDKKEAKATRKKEKNRALLNEQIKIKPSENNDAKKEAKATRKKEKILALWNEDRAALSKMINDIEKEAKATRKQLKTFDLWNEESNVKPREITDNKKEAKATRKKEKKGVVLDEDLDKDHLEANEAMNFQEEKEEMDLDLSNDFEKDLEELTSIGDKQKQQKNNNNKKKRKKLQSNSKTVVDLIDKPKKNISKNTEKEESQNNFLETKEYFPKSKRANTNVTKIKHKKAVRKQNNFHKRVKKNKLHSKEAKDTIMMLEKTNNKSNTHSSNQKHKIKLEKAMKTEEGKFTEIKLKGKDVPVIDSNKVEISKKIEEEMRLKQEEEKFNSLIQQDKELKDKIEKLFKLENEEILKE